MEKNPNEYCSYLYNLAVGRSDAIGTLLDCHERVGFRFVSHDLRSDGRYGDGVVLHFVLGKGSLLALIEFQGSQCEVEGLY